MAQLLIRDIEPATIQFLKLQAKEHHRSLQGELKSIIEAATAARTMSKEEVRRTCKAWHKRLAGNTSSDSAKLLREDRNR